MTLLREGKCTIGTTPGTYELRDSGFYVDGSKLPLDGGVVELALAAHRLESGEDLSNGQGLLPCTLAERIIRTAGAHAIRGLAAEVSRIKEDGRPEGDPEEGVVQPRTEGYLDDDALTESLVNIIRYLKAPGGNAPSDQVEKKLAYEIQRFGQHLEEHLSFEEETLFPSLREVNPEWASQVSTLQDEHSELRTFQRHLADRAGLGDTRGACEIARALLARLLDHMERESLIVDRITNPGSQF